MRLHDRLQNSKAQICEHFRSTHVLDRQGTVPRVCPERGKPPQGTPNPSLAHHFFRCAWVVIYGYAFGLLNNMRDIDVLQSREASFVYLSNNNKLIVAMIGGVRRALVFVLRTVLCIFNYVSNFYSHTHTHTHTLWILRIRLGILRIRIGNMACRAVNCLYQCGFLYVSTCVYR